MIFSLKIAHSLFKLKTTMPL